MLNNDIIKILTGMLNQFSASSNVSENLNRILQEITTLIDAEASSFFFFDSKNNVLICQSNTGPVDIKGLTLQKNQGIVGEVFQNKKSRLIADVKKEANHLSKVDEKTGFQTKSLMTVPIIFDAKIYGCLQALNKKNTDLFDEKDLQYFELLALNLGIILKNVELTEKAVLDKLIEKDIADARSAQTVLFPSVDLFEHIAGGVTPYRELSGDFIDYFAVKDEKIAFIQGDVSGKGVPATIMMSRCMSLFRLFAKQELSAADIAKKMNEEIYGHGTDDRFATCVVGWLENNKLEFVNCGHNPVLYYMNNEYKSFGSTAPPLGIVDQVGFIPDIKKIEMVKGSSVYITTDGITEAKINNVEIDTKGLASMAKTQSDNTSAPDRYKQIKNYLMKPAVEINDDATLLIILSRK